MDNNMHVEDITKQYNSRTYETIDDISTFNYNISAYYLRHFELHNQLFNTTRARNSWLLHTRRFVDCTYQIIANVN